MVSTCPVDGRQVHVTASFAGTQRNGRDALTPGARRRSAAAVVRQLACDLGRRRGIAGLLCKRLSGAVTRALTLDFVDRQSVTSVSPFDYRPRRNRLVSSPSSWGFARRNEISYRSVKPRFPLLSRALSCGVALVCRRWTTFETDVDDENATAISRRPGPKVRRLFPGGRRIQTSGSWSRDRQTVMGDGTAVLKTAADL